MSVTRKWSLMATVLVAAILAAGWFLLVSPKRGEAASLRDQALSQQDANTRLVQQLEVLKAQQAELPEQRAALAAMRVQVPDNPALPTLVRDLTAAGRKVGVSIDSMAPAVPTALVAPQPVAAPVAPAEGAAPAEGTAPAEGAAAAEGEAASAEAGTVAVTPAAPVVAPTSLYQVPLALSVTGSYFELEQFVNKLEGLKRSFLVTGFTVTPGQAESSDTAGSSGDLTLALQGRVFLAPEVVAPAPPVAAAPAVPAQ